jgi:hypothetical protein
MRKLLLISVLVEFMSFAASRVDTALAQTPEETMAEGTIAREETIAGEETISEEITTEETTAAEETTGEETTAGEKAIGEESVGEQTAEETTAEDTAGQGNKVERTRRERCERTRGGTTEAPSYNGGTPGNNREDGDPARVEGGAWGGFTGSVNDAFGNVSRGRLPDTGGGWAVLLLAGLC